MVCVAHTQLWCNVKRVSKGPASAVVFAVLPRLIVSITSEDHVCVCVFFVCCPACLVCYYHQCNLNTFCSEKLKSRRDVLKRVEACQRVLKRVKVLKSVKVLKRVKDC
eukprot:scpid91642/ scgid11941/ 